MEQKAAPPRADQGSSRASTWWIRTIFYVPPALLMAVIAGLSLAKGILPPNFWACCGMSALCVAALEWLLGHRSKG